MDRLGQRAQRPIQIGTGARDRVGREREDAAVAHGGQGGPALPVFDRGRHALAGIENDLGRGGDEPLERHARVRLVERLRHQIVRPRGAQHLVEKAAATDEIERVALEHQHLDRSQRLVQRDVLEHQDVYAQRLEALAQIALLRARNQRDQIGLERHDGLQAGVEQPADPGQPAHLGPHARRVVVHPHQRRQRVEGHEDLGEGRIERDDAGRGRVRAHGGAERQE